MLDQFLQELFAPDQAQGWSPMTASSSPPDFNQRFAGMPGADMGTSVDRMLANDGYRAMGDNNPTPVIHPDALMKKLNGGANFDPTFNQNTIPQGDPEPVPPSQGILPVPSIDPNDDGADLPPNARPTGFSPPGNNGDPNTGETSPSTGAGPGNPIFDKLAGVFGGKLLNAAQSGHPEARSVLGRLMGMNKRGDQQFRASLAGGMASGNPNFKLSAAMKGAGGAMGGGLGQENLADKEDIALAEKQRVQANYERSQAEKEQTGAALRTLYGARTNAAVNGRPSTAWNKPASERWKDANRLIIDKQKQLNASVNPLAPKAEREAAKAAAAKELADFKKATYQQYGFTADGQDQAPAPRKGGEVPSSGKVVGDKEATDEGLYPKGTYDDPFKPESKEEFDALPPGAIFVNPADGQIMTKRAS